ncbi:SDR family NAD(P)-dependent oxidoreductase [Brevibacillus massiliensis]|jgi:NAD(P)-dependent dehydrogenase (short-subunit alcohol dehydrogenase family)|uniref:SDR family NAD(P)-dependent oxidoreductase n=1 Tax=Brevibacillus massiliensis TaxID=1118054 RepID=UPI0002EBDD89|nr:SDR family oxidoreductase [Brevibacillus massiliensis]
MEADKVAIITGAAGGIGRASVFAFLQAGYSVAMVDRDTERLMTLLQEVTAAGMPSDQVICLPADIADQSQVESLIARTIEHFGRLDVMFNNAGMCTNIPFLAMTAEQYDEVVRVNQYGTFYGIQAAAHAMIGLGISGVIINSSSIFQEVASPGVIHYHASKAAIQMMTKSAALELAPHGIRVVGIAPGIVDTPMLQRDKELGLWETLQQKHMRGKALQPEEIASVAVFLCSPQANGINGSIIPIEDGLLGKY